MHVIEQPLPPAPEHVAEPNVVDQWTALYDAHTEIAYLMLGSMTPELHRQFELYYPFDMTQELRSMFEKQAAVEKFDLIQSFHAFKQEEGKPVADYVLKMKGYVEKLERLGYVLPQDISVGLILNGLTKDFVGFVRNYNMHRAPNRLCLNVEVEEHSLGDLNEPTSYKAAMLDLESNKWIDAMNAEIHPGSSSSFW
ncbi:hypothetical protein Tco_1143458 [Tanacetum coccineum]